MIHVLLPLVPADVLESEHPLLVLLDHPLIDHNAVPEYKARSRKCIPIYHVITYKLVQLEQGRLGQGQVVELLE